MYNTRLSNTRSLFALCANRSFARVLLNNIRSVIDFCLNKYLFIFSRGQYFRKSNRYTTNTFHEIPNNSTLILFEIFVVNIFRRQIYTVKLYYYTVGFLPCLFCGILPQTMWTRFRYKRIWLYNSRKTFMTRNFFALCTRLIFTTTLRFYLFINIRNVKNSNVGTILFLLLNGKSVFNFDLCQRSEMHTDDSLFWNWNILHIKIFIPIVGLVRDGFESKSVSQKYVIVFFTYIFTIIQT